MLSARYLLHCVPAHLFCGMPSSRDYVVWQALTASSPVPPSRPRISLALLDAPGFIWCPNRTRCCPTGIQLWELRPPEEEPEAAAGFFTKNAAANAAALGPALGGALAAVRALLLERGGPPAVVFDGLHAEDVPVAGKVRSATGTFSSRSLLVQISSQVRPQSAERWLPCVRTLLERGGRLAVVFDGLHAEDVRRRDAKASPHHTVLCAARL